MKVQRYRRDSEVSYTLGATLTFELLKCRPETVTRIFISSETGDSEGIREILSMAETLKIPVEKNDKAFNILSPKGNCYMIGEFRKVPGKLEKGDHIVLVNPSDAGNMGTIVRTATGFGLTSIAVIRPAVDFFDPRTVRASMGAAFHVQAEYFDSFAEYMARFPENHRYAFMLQSSRPLTKIKRQEPFSLVFGNEATGLPDGFQDYCESVIIRHSHDIDSLNLPMAAGIAMFEFTRERWEET